MPRMKILNALEYEEFEKPPIFHSTERKKFFDFPEGLNLIAESLRTSTNKICFLLVAGYFKATKKFFPAQFHQNDIHYLAQQRNVNTSDINLSDYGV